ncbi:hypothetical protein Tco_0458196 [Tanacetum coccineum]
MEHISPIPAISPFLCTDSSEAPDSSDGPPSQDPYVATVARWRSRVTTRPSSSHEFPIAPVTAPPGIRRRSATLIRIPREGYSFFLGFVNLTAPISTGRIITHLLPVHLRILRQFILWVLMRQIRLIRDLRLEMYHPDCVTLRGEHQDVVRHFVVGVLLHYLLCIHRTYIEYLRRFHRRDPCIHLQHSAGPSVRDVRYSDSVSLSIPVTGSLAPTRADHLPPRKRFRDSYSSVASLEEDAEVGLTGTRVDMELGIGDGDEVGDHVDIDHRDARDDTEEYEADASTGDTTEAGIDPMTAPLVEEEIVEPAGENSPDSSDTRDGIVRSVEDKPVDLSDAVRDFYHHMSEVRVDRIVGIETAQGSWRRIS